MKISEQISAQVRAVYFGGNWTASCLKEHLSSINWETAQTKMGNLNSIAVLVYHMQYYVRAVTKVLQGGPLDASDRFSFDLPPIGGQQGWEQFLEECWADGEAFARAIEAMPDDQLLSDFDEGKYGNHFRNITGVLEHLHYHLGQVVILKKLQDQSGSNATMI